MTPATPARAAAAPRPKRLFARKLVFWPAFALFILLGVAGLRRAAEYHLRAMSVLTRLANPTAHGFSVRFAQHPVREETGIAETQQEPLKFRMFIPQDVSHPPGVVLLHGIHRDGIEEPRLINFGRALAGAGLEVMTPELRDLADYQVSPRTIDTIGQAAQMLCDKMHRSRVAVTGVSFGGGLALLAANRPEYRDRIGMVLAVGAHDDMERVARFFAANMIEKPDGSRVAFQAHEYGALVLAYSHPEDFFTPRDVAVAHEALRLWLWEQPEASMKTADALSPSAKRTLDLLLHHRALLQQAFLREIERHSDEMHLVSPHGHLSQLRAAVFLLHGSSDSVIPASETLWLAKDVPVDDLKGALVSRAMNMIHVDGQHPVRISEKWELIDFLAKVLKATDRITN